MKKITFSIVESAVFAIYSISYSQAVTHNNVTVNMEFVNIGYTGNSVDTTGYGAVSYGYEIAKYEVTAQQWNAVISADSNVGNAGGWSGSQPSAGANWFEAAKFCNWLTSGDAYNGAYQFTNDILTGVDRDSAIAAFGKIYVLPTEDEWYKAAYFKAEGSGYTLYPTGNTVPDMGNTGVNYGMSGAPWDVGSGIVENNGTYDMAGNLWEWTQSASDGTLDDMMERRELRGGHFDDWNEVYLACDRRVRADPSYEDDWIIGFRVASISSEPSCPSADLTDDCFVDNEDFAWLASWWLVGDCNTKNWCGGADFDMSGDVGLEDLKELAAQWLSGEQ